MKLLTILFTTFILALVATKIFRATGILCFPEIWEWLFSSYLQDFLILNSKRNGNDDSGFYPGKTILGIHTGIIEIAAGVGLMIPSIRELTAILLIVFYVWFSLRISIHPERKSIFLKQISQVPE
jgi:hypothetical protein